MYLVQDETFQGARSIVSALARELAGQEESGSRYPVDIRDLVRRSADLELPASGEADYLSAVATDLARLFSIEEIFPRKRRGGR